MSKTVLVIDDEAGYRALLASDITRLGYSVLTAANGLDALAILKEKKVDVVVTDMKMSPMDGLDVLIAIKSARIDVPVILMTGYALEERVREALRYNVKNCLRKPFQIAEMRNVIKTAVETGFNP